MATYVTLINWTDQGIREFKDTVQRAQNFTSVVERHDGQVRQLLWTVGQYDIVAVVDLADDETLTAILLQVGALGNVRSHTMRAFDAEAMERIVSMAS